MPGKIAAISTLRQLAAPVLVFSSFFLLRPDHALYSDPGFVAVVLLAGAICGGISCLFSIPSAIGLTLLFANLSAAPNYRSEGPYIGQLFVIAPVLFGTTFLAGAGALLAAMCEENVLNRDGNR
jgi:hypothetical protein